MQHIQASMTKTSRYFSWISGGWVSHFLLSQNLRWVIIKFACKIFYINIFFKSCTTASIFFTIDSSTIIDYCALFQPGYAHGLGSLQLQNGSSPTVSKTSIYAGINIVDCRTPAMPICCYNGHVYLEHAEIVRERNRTKGLKLHLFTEGIENLILL